MYKEQQTIPIRMVNYVLLGTCDTCQDLIRGFRRYSGAPMECRARLIPALWVRVVSVYRLIVYLNYI